MSILCKACLLWPTWKQTVEIYFPLVEFIKMYDSHKNVCGSSPVLFLCSRKPPQTGNAKKPPLNRPSKYVPPATCTWKIALKYKVKQSKNGKLTSNYKGSPIRIRAFEKYKPRCLFLEFYGSSFERVVSSHPLCVPNCCYGMLRHRRWTAWGGRT